MSAPIESYGLIGDCEAAALVGLDGSIDWLCWPRFDSDACFARLLGGQSNGFWLIAPSDTPTSVSRRYRPDTLILETTFETATGKATLIDFMLPRNSSSDLVRIVRCDEGEVTMCMELALRFGYGATTPWVTRLKDGAVRAVAGPDMAVLRSPAFLRGENFKTVAQFHAFQGQDHALRAELRTLAPPGAGAARAPGRARQVREVLVRLDGHDEDRRSAMPRRSSAR